MPSSNKSISLCILLILVLAIFLPPTAFCEKKTQANITTPEAIGTTGVLSIGPDGKIYIQFTKSHIKSAVGDLIMGEDIFKIQMLTQEQSDQNEIQKAAYIAYDAWLKCEEARKKFANGKTALIQMEFECTRYKKLSALESLVGVTAIINNNLGSDIEWAEPVYEISKLDVEKYTQEVENLIVRGAIPTTEGYELPGEAERFTTDAIPTGYDTSDQELNPEEEVIDSVPVVDTGTAHTSLSP